MYEIWIEEIIRNRDGRIVDTVCRMDGIRSHVDPESLIRIHEERGTVANIDELIAQED